MKEQLIFIGIFFLLRFIENIVNKWVENSKLTSNTWDDMISKLLLDTLKSINSIFKFKKK